ncbi:MAG: TVP38/TMEM64 family protein [Alphaproteobacteria bacterium]|nr:TVP38/TMEM64 family protein [Alphaproteobacteria bacterium]
MALMPLVWNVLWRRKMLGRLLVIAAIAIGIGFAAHYRNAFDVEAIKAWVAGFGALAPILFIIAYTISVTVFVPATLLTLAGGMLFGPVWGTLYSLVAATIAATFMMLIARYVAGDAVATRAGRRLRAIMAGVEEEGWRFVFLMRLIPGIPFAVLSYALGLTRIRLMPLALATLFGMVPATIVINYVGYAGREAALGGEAIAEKALIGLGALAALALITRLVLKFRKRRLSAPPSDAARD